MSKVRVAFYKGPAGSFWQKVGHWATCVWTQSKYSHCEIEVDGVCYSSSARDGGVRAKEIDLGSGRWDVFDWPDDSAAERVHELFNATAGSAYDWAGVLRFILPVLPRRRWSWFCSEWCSLPLGFGEPQIPPQVLYELVKARLANA